jgi:hypothetical protein
MSHPYDHVDMGREHGLDDRTAEDILRGRADAVGAEHQGLADALNAIRHSASAQPRPSEQLQSIFANGIAEDELADAPSTAPAKRPPPAVLARGGASLRGSVAKVAGLSLLVKLTLGGVAVAAAGVGGAGMAGVLPGQDGPEPGPAEEADVGQDIADDAIEEGGVDGQDVSREVSERVREPRGDEPGGELPRDWGWDIDDQADDADEPGEDPRDHAPEEADRGLDEAERRTEDAPAGERTPDTADDAREDADDRAERRSGEDRAPVEGQPEDQQPGSVTGSSAAEPAPDEPSTQPSQGADTAAPGDRTLGR